MPTRDDADALDRGDPLGALRHEFVATDDGTIYADGNSLGRLPKASRAALQRVVDDEWGRDLIASWDVWLDLPERVGDMIGQSFLGARVGETIVADSTTVNFYKLAVAALRASAPRRIVITDRGNFPTNRFVLDGLDATVVHLPVDPSIDDVSSALDRHRGDVALVTLSLVDYRSGALLDLPAVTRTAHDHGALVLWDVSHAVGAVAIDLDGSDADLAVGCTYKYLDGGPGSPAFLYVNERIQARIGNPIQGWFGARDQFAMGDAYAAAPGVRRFLSGTPPILALRSLEAAVGVLARAGIDALATKGRTMTEFAIACADDLLVPLGFEVATPRDPSRRGAHVALRHPEAWQICQALIEHAGVVPDFREPDIVRLGFAPAYTRYADVYEAVERVAGVVRLRRHDAMPAERRRVT